MTLNARTGEAYSQAHVKWTLAAFEQFTTQPRPRFRAAYMDPEALAMFREAMTPAKHQHHDASNISITAGTSLSYTLDRLKREAMTPAKHVHNDGSNVTINRGNHLSYTLDRLKREAMKGEPGSNQYSSADNMIAPTTPTGTSLSYTLDRLKLWRCFGRR